MHLDGFWKYCKGEKSVLFCIFTDQRKVGPFFVSRTSKQRKEINMLKQKENVIVKFDFSAEQTVGEITKIIGLSMAKYLVPVIDFLNLEANPRSSKTGSVTDAIQESIEKDPLVFPFKTKGILLASSGYERLDRGRIKIIPEDPKIEGILDGGHNTLAIGLYILKKAMEYRGMAFPKGAKTWDEFKQLWEKQRDAVEEYLDAMRADPDMDSLNFYVPIELLVPRDAEEIHSVESFKNDLLEICAARNNNVQLPISAKANQLGYFDDLRGLMDRHNSLLSSRIEWKTNDGGDVKAQDIIALAWIPLNLITPVKDSYGRTVEPVLAQNIYRGKGSCLKQFEKLMSSPDVTMETGADYKHKLVNEEVRSALRIAVELPELYDYIYEMFPRYYNAAGGIYGQITAVKKLNDKRKDKVTPFTGKEVEKVSPEGFIVPLVYGLQALMESKEIDGHTEICWKQPPMLFLHSHLQKIVRRYCGIISTCDYDPQKIGKNPFSYEQALSAFAMAIAGI